MGRERKHTSCKVTGCPEEHSALGYCIRHYRAFHKYGDPLYKIYRVHKMCSVDGCNSPHSAKGYCPSHYEAHKKYGDGFLIKMKQRQKFDENDYIGKKFALLTIVNFTRIKIIGNNGQIARLCLAKCECGSIKEYYLYNIKNGRSQSCGCKEVIGSKNGVSKNPLYQTYTGMIGRCYLRKYKAYKNYGGRGITVCDRWLEDANNFIADMGEKPSPEYSLDRIDVNGNYEPSNCRWATAKMQMNNTRLSNELTAGALAKLTGYTRERIRQLTYKSSSSHSTKPILSSFIDRAYRGIGNKKVHYIYKQEAIEFLRDRKNSFITKGETN